MSVDLNYVVVSQEACGMVAYCELNKTVDEVAKSILSPHCAEIAVRGCGSQDLLLNGINEFGMVTSSEMASYSKREI